MADPLYTVSADQLTAENIFFEVDGRPIVSGGTISARKGSVTGLLGRNGSGKSTMLQCIFGTRRATECDVFVNGVKMPRPYTHAGLLAYLPQRPFMPPTITVRSALRNFGVSVAEVLEHFPALQAELDRQIHELSGGTERLLSAIVILLAPRRFTFLDEPFSHIMPLHVETLKQLIVQQSRHKGIVITDHMYKHLLPICDTLYLMKEGKTILIRDPQELVLHGYLPG
ncbi:MAG: ABC transporter ATP-binding protein [Taibaiella sp.]|nr:ABC transporter ATP-binding protein [Taibaiella sp.]